MDLILKKLETLDELKQEFPKLKQEFQELKQEFQDVKTQLNENTQLAKAIRDRQEETDAKLESLTMDVHKIHGELSSLKQGQDRQDKILEALAMRSLEQETELRDLKRVK